MKPSKSEGRFFFQVSFFKIFVLSKEKYQNGHLGRNENFVGCLYTCFELWYCFYFELRGGEEEEEHAVIFWQLGMKGDPAGLERAEERGISGPPRAPVLHEAPMAALHPPSAQTKCMSPLLDAPHEARPWGGCNQLLLLPCSVLPVLFFFSFST